MGSVAWPNFFNGFGGGFVFVPLTTLAMGRLRKQEIGNAAGIYNLVRNIGGSIGISALTAFLVARLANTPELPGSAPDGGQPGDDGNAAGADGEVRAGWRRCA